MLLYTANHQKFAFHKESYDDMSHENGLGLIGVPFDSTTIHHPGTRFGPRFLREASYHFEKYHLILDKFLDLNLYDWGDLQIVPGNFSKTAKNLKVTIKDVLDKNSIPLVLGGEHSISIPVIEALDVDNLTIIHMDAHFDLRDEYLGEKYSHATVMRRVWELEPQEIIQIGIRSASREEMEFHDQQANLTYYSNHIIKDEIKLVLKRIKDLDGPLYVSVDIDVLDPAHAPSVGSPVPGGLTPLEVEAIILQLKGKEVVGFDLVEVASTKIGDVTSINGAKILYDFLATTC